jgi:hypothetical protein
MTSDPYELGVPMKFFIFLTIMICACSTATALERLSESAMKEATAQMGDAGDAAGDSLVAADPLLTSSDSFAPVFSPVGPLVYIYDIASPHVDPAAQVVDTSDTAAPVFLVLRTAGDVTALGGLF